jgi:hypothetical protein
MFGGRPTQIRSRITPESFPQQHPPNLPQPLNINDLELNRYAEKSPSEHSNNFSSNLPLFLIIRHLLLILSEEVVH